MDSEVNLPSEPLSPIKTIDFSAYLNGSDSQGIADEILQSFKSIGFVCLVNHGLPLNNIQDMFDWSRRFFALPAEVKQLAPHPPSGAHHRGYSSPGLERVTQHIYDEAELKASREQTRDLKESFESGREDDSIQPNIWIPDDVIPGFKDACLDFFWSCYKLERDILRALALSLKLPEEYFVNLHRNADNQLRLLHYPAVKIEDLVNEKYSRIGAHSDFGTITLLFQDDVGGLEIEDPNDPNTFIPVRPIPNSVVVNAGDLMMRWSNDIIKSTIHRVRSPPDFGTSDGTSMVPERYSIPYFCSVDMSTVVATIPGTWTEANPKKYEPISAQEYIMKRMEALY